MKTLKTISKPKNIIKILFIVIFYVVFFLGLFLSNKSIALLSIIFSYLFVLVDIYHTKKEGYIYFIIFFGFIFLFILSRPTIALLRGTQWGYFNAYAVFTSLFIILNSLVFLYLGFNFGSNKLRKMTLPIKNNFDTHKFLQILYVICLGLLVGSFIRAIMYYLRFHGNYLLTYKGVSANIPVILNMIDGLAIYFIVAFLALLPNKKKTVIILISYVICGIPYILVGSRSSIMIRILFCLVYFVLRESLTKNHQWLGAFEKKLIIICIPFLMVGLSIINYTRSNNKVVSHSPITLAVDFLDKQGTSFDTLCETIVYRSSLRNNYYLNYTFGELIDFLMYNNLSNYLFGTPELDGNSVQYGTISNNLSHRIGYLVLKQRYLNGEGRGTTYFSELYLDFGYLGIIVFNFILGVFFRKINKLFLSGSIIRFILLNVLLNLFLIPRSAVFSLVSFIINYYFWATVVILAFISFIFNKNQGLLFKRSDS